MKILVTGREGQLATSLRERSRGVGSVELVTLGRPQLDLEALESIAPALRAVAPDVVINAAAYTAVDQAEDEPERAFRINAEAAGRLSAAAKSVDARFIQISTDYVFDGESEAPYAEAAQPNPLGVYGRSKLQGEKQARAENPDAIIVRTAWVYSPFGRNFVRTMLALAEQRDSLSVVADQSGSPSSALDLADGLLSMVSRWNGTPKTGLGGTYHLAGSGFATWFDVAKRTFDAAGRLGSRAPEVRPIATSDWPTKAVRPKSSRLDCSKYQADFGYRAPDWNLSLSGVVERLVRAA